MNFKLACVSCGKEFASDSQAMTCLECGAFKGTLDVVYSYETLKAHYRDGLPQPGKQSVFESFLPILPFADLASLPPIPVGNTPMFKSPNLSAELKLSNLWLKDDGRNPSASLKDRASAVAIAMAKESKASIIAAASTGNAASSLATLAASTSMKTILFVPKTIPKPKLAQLLIHGAEIICLDCSYDEAFDLCQKACDKFGWYNRNTAVNPYTGEGKKTAALEIACVLQKAPDAVICPVGDGCIISGLYKGFTDLKNLGLISQIPRLYGVQALGAAPLVKAYETNSEIKPLTNICTIADSISVGYPRDGVKALRAIRNSGGAMVAVSDDEILKAQKLLASKAGVFAEPAASAAIAGLLKLQVMKSITTDETIVTLLTGHGLKDIASVMNNTKMEVEILKPDMDSISARIRKIISSI